MKKEFNILNYFNMRALFFGMGISNILILAKETVWLSLLLGTIFGILIINCIKISITRNFINIIVSSTLIIIAYIILVNLISTMYMTSTPKIIIGLPIFLLTTYVLSKKNIVVYRLANVLLIFNICFYLFSILLLIPHFDLSNFVYSNTPFKKTLLAAFYYAILSTTPTLVTRFNEFKNYNLTKTYLISSITMSIIIIFTYGILGEYLSEMFRYPEYIILKKITVLDFIENFENIISFMWIHELIMLMLSSGLNIKYNIKNKWIFNGVLTILLIISIIINKYYLLLLPVYNYILFTCLTCLILLIIFNNNLIKKKN